ncbi:MAG TPA: amidohydrolase family protein [Spirochaetota bacterium]|jgi:hypothetical protein|nr:MAG: Amidohydrolase [Spirochaetes bacterium ADurb.Bin133]HNZ26829.1 amidohydrolase family protein [Spirochaetota bacterium]HPY88381.1 amidohydrolase family protein [Spirochaetota bacterium]HQB60339.1 amidohydrolase family protein [Spirochaetota bacterium]
MTRKIIDVHAHVFPEKTAEKAVASIGDYYSLPMAGLGTVRDLIDSGSKIGVSRYVINSSAVRPDLVVTINNFITGETRNNADLVGFGTLHPDFDDIEAEFDRIVGLGVKGIKLHPEFQNFNIDDAKMFWIYKTIEGKAPLLIHMGDANKDSSSPKRLRSILDKFPDLVVIAAHFGGYQMWKESQEYLIGSNIYLDTSSSLSFLSKKETLSIINKHGVDKILFGSDYPMWSHQKELDMILNLGLSEEELDKILSQNAAKLLEVTL